MDATLSERGTTKAYNHVNDFRRCPECGGRLGVNTNSRNAHLGRLARVARFIAGPRTST